MTSTALLDLTDRREDCGARETPLNDVCGHLVCVACAVTIQDDMERRAEMIERGDREYGDVPL